MDPEWDGGVGTEVDMVAGMAVGMAAVSVTTQVPRAGTSPAMDSAATVGMEDTADMAATAGVTAAMVARTALAAPALVLGSAGSPPT